MDSKTKLNRPRKLGGDYEDWDGMLEENEGDLDTSPYYALSFIGFAVMIICLLSGFLLYLVQPRLESIHPTVSVLIECSLLAGCGILIFGYICVVLSVMTEKPFAFFLRKKEIINTSIIPLTFMIGQKCGLSKDRLKNSLLKISNAINRSLYRSVQPKELLILVPRCLSGLVRKELTALTERYGVTFHTASGGNKARELLYTKKPKAVIGVACERDLFSGVQDVGGSVPVITIANKRPDGPCMNTHIHLEEMEEAIRFFLGYHTSVKISSK